MTKLTEKQQGFIANKAAGVPNREAAIAAGYAPNSADVAAGKLLRRADIKAAIKAASKGVDTKIGMPTMPRTHYADAMTFLVDVIDHGKLPIAMRADAAKQLLPYHHARIGEAGKKQKAKDRAAELAGGGQSKFSPKVSPPSLHAIKGGKET